MIKFSENHAVFCRTLFAALFFPDKHVFTNIKIKFNWASLLRCYRQE